MSQHHDPRPKPLHENTAQPQTATDPLDLESVPTGDFIDVASNRPVDPTRLQVFQIPKQFLDWVRSKEPPHLDPEYLKESSPQGLPVGPRKQKTIPEPVSEFTPRSIAAIARPKAAATTGPSTTVHVALEPALTTAAMKVRGPVTWLHRWALTGRTPKRVKLSLAAIVGILLLIVLWRHVESSAPNNTTPHEVASNLVPPLSPLNTSRESIQVTQAAASSPVMQVPVASQSTLPQPGQESANSHPRPAMVSKSPVSSRGKSQKSGQTGQSAAAAAVASATSAARAVPPKRAWFSEE